jgi:hypothetical protein
MYSRTGIADEKSWKNAHAVLGHLDLLKPVMTLDLSILETHIETILSYLPSNVTLEFWTVSPPTLVHYFPFYSEVFDPIVELLAFKRVDNLKLISVLDLITTLTIFMFGEWNRKSKILFQLYNLNKTGLMEEEELYILIKHVSNCFKKLKLVGILDIEDHDAKFFALNARIRQDGSGRSYFIPGLYYDDFHVWTTTAEECKSLFAFFRVLNRLCEMLITLTNRSKRMLDIVSDMYEGRYDPVPEVVENANLLVSDEVALSYRTKSSIFLLINSKSIKGQRICISIAKEVYLDTLYDIDSSIIDRNRSAYDETQAPGIKCCDKYYKKTKVVVFPVARKEVTGQLFTLMEVTGLDPSSMYELSVYSDDCSFHKCRVQTITNKPFSTSRKVTILPSSVNHRQLHKAIDDHQLLTADDVLVFTGSISSIETVRSFFFVCLRMQINSYVNNRS